MTNPLLPEIIPSPEEVIGILKSTGALRYGRFKYPTGLYSNQYLQIALAMRDFQVAKRLSVALSRKVRQNKELRAMIPHLSIVSPATGGLPVAYGIVEALRANQVYWAEEDIEGRPQRFRQFIEPKKGEKILIVDDILRTGKKVGMLRDLIREHGAQVVGVAVMVYQPTPVTPAIEDVPFFHLARLDTMYYQNEQSVQLKPDEEVIDIWV